MVVFGMLRITPITEKDITADVAAALDALDEHDVAYETNPMSTVIEAETIHDLFAAVEAAHEAVDGDHINTLLQIDDMRTKSLDAASKVAAVEEELGRDAKSSR